jgi:hypothetical protein
MSPISEFTNEIYDQDSLSDAFKEGADIYTIFLGVVVTLLPKIIPRVMPALVPEQNLREKFNDDDYVKGVEDLFREKFLQNLEAIENLVHAWKDNTLDSDGILSKEDFVVGDAEGFQNDILSAIRFLQDRMQRSNDPEATDGITRLANSIWRTANTAFTVVSAYMRH